ncbi:hypothetical protein AB0M44_32295 [Streptosporangium subroseum]|uniref:hypothetical protein n=1 Tax=Streptosporangium subroseum TaxID=106412 RepID=UPI00344452EF
MTQSLRLVPITPANIEAAIAVEVRPGQERFVAPVVQSLAEAYVYQKVAWPRLILDGDRPVGFLMAFHGRGRRGVRLWIAVGLHERGGDAAVRAVADEDGTQPGGERLERVVRVGEFVRQRDQRVGLLLEDRVDERRAVREVAVERADARPAGDGASWSGASTSTSSAT